MSEFNPGRRAFFRRMVKPVSEVKTPEVAPVRPPFALAEAAFKETCTQCGECLKACPGNLIEVIDEYPVLVGESACDSCLDCVMACSSGALAGEKLLPRINSQCDPDLARFCGDCMNACEAGAITITGGQQPEIDAEICTSCGACRSACDDFAIEMVKRPVVARSE